MMNTKTFLIAMTILFLSPGFYGQSVPAVEENIPFLVTFGNKAEKSYGDDDFTQTFFFVVPVSHTQPIYIRVFDPDIGGQHDEMNSSADTKTSFSVYGGKGCISNKDARSTDPVGNYRSGTLLKTKTFNSDSKYDNKWYTFGPLNPTEGELQTNYGGYIFKVIARGIAGNDGNLYRYHLSTMKDQNRSVEGGNAFTFEYCFRLHKSSKQVSHIYPYIDDKVISVRQSNFDWDYDGVIRIVSSVRKGEKAKCYGDNKWATSSHKIYPSERGKSLDIQFVKKTGSNSDNNNVVFFITNQYGEMLPFYTIPIGGIPVYKYKIKAREK